MTTWQENFRTSGYMAVRHYWIPRMAAWDEDFLFMRSQGMSLDDIAKNLGIQRDSLIVKLRRHGMDWRKV